MSYCICLFQENKSYGSKKPFVFILWCARSCVGHSTYTLTFIFVSDPFLYRVQNIHSNLCVCETYIYTAYIYIQSTVCICMRPIRKLPVLPSPTSFIAFTAVCMCVCVCWGVRAGAGGGVQPRTSD